MEKIVEFFILDYPYDVKTNKNVEQHSFLELGF